MGRRRKKAPIFVASEEQEFPQLPVEQGFEAAYVQIGSVRITNHGLGRSRPLHQHQHQRPAQPLQRRQHPQSHPQRQRQRQRAGAGCSSDTDNGDNSLDEELADYLANILGTGSGSGEGMGSGEGSDRRLGGSRGPGSTGGSRWQGPAKAGCGKAGSNRGLDAEELEEEDGLAEQEEEQDDEEEEEEMEEQEGEEEDGGGEKRDEEAEEGEEGEEEEEEEEKADEEVRGDDAMLRRLLRGFAARDLGSSDGEEGDGGRSNLYETLLAASSGGGSSSISEDNDRGGDAMVHKGARDRLRADGGRTQTRSCGYFYEIRVGPDGREEVVVVLEEGAAQPQPSAATATTTGDGDVEMTGADAGDAVQAAVRQPGAEREQEGGDEQQPASQPPGVEAGQDDGAASKGRHMGAAGREEAAAAAVEFNRFPFMMRTREQVRASAAAAASGAAAVVMAKSASGGATPSAPRSSRSRQQQQQLQPQDGAGGEGRQRSAAKGAFGGALRPGEKKQLRKEKIRAKRSAREAARGFDVVRLAEQIADFVAGDGDVLALEPLGPLGTTIAQSLAGVYGLRHSVQGSGKKRFLLLQPTDRTKASDAKTKDKVDKIVAREVERQRRGAAAGTSVGPAGMAMQDVTAASVAAARRGRKGGASGGCSGGSGSKAPSRRQAAAAAGYSQPVAFVRCGVQRGGDGEDVVQDDEGAVQSHDAAQGNPGEARSRSGDEPDDAMTVEEATAAATAAAEAEAEEEEEEEEEEQRGSGRVRLRHYQEMEAADPAEAADEEDAQPQHHGIGFPDEERDFLAVAFGGLGFRPSCRQRTTGSGPPHSDGAAEAQAAPPLVPAAEPLCPVADDGAAAASADDGRTTALGADGSGGGDGVEGVGGGSGRHLVSPEGVSYFRAHFCLGQGYYAEESDIQVCTTGIQVPMILGEDGGEDGVSGGGGGGTGGEVSRGADEYGAINAENPAAADAKEEGVWMRDRRRGKVKKAKAGGGGGGGRGRAGLMAAAGPAASLDGELGKTSQQAKVTGKKAAKEARRQERRLQQQQWQQQQQGQQQQQQGQQQQQVEVLPPLQPSGQQQQHPGPSGASQGSTQPLGGRATAPADLSFEYASFERHGTGIGSRLMARMGWSQGDGLGRARQGRAEPLRASIRPRSLGLGADG